MSKKEAISRYNLIINKLRRKPASFEEILDHLIIESEIQSYDFVISKRTFQRDLNDLRSIYGIDVVYDKRDKVYYIDHAENTIVNERIIEAYNTFNALSLNDRIAENIDFEQRSTFGTEHLYGILHAIKNHLQLNFNYQSFSNHKPGHRRVEPYFLKEYKRRWYLICVDGIDAKIKSYALDRIIDLEITKLPFEKPKPLTIDSYYKDSFGIVGPNLERPAEDIILEFTAHQGKYIKTLPLHHSQEVIEEDSDMIRIKLKLHVTYDFIMEILSHGNAVKVCSPASLVSDIKNTLKKSLEQYI